MRNRKLANPKLKVTDYLKMRLKIKSFSSIYSNREEKEKQTEIAKYNNNPSKRNDRQQQKLKAAVTC